MSAITTQPVSERRGALDWQLSIAADLAEVERIYDEALCSPRPCVADMLANLEPYRGKRLRPSLLLLTASACGKVTHAHRVLGAVVEMIHTATLVHDDVLDNATVRRHRPTIRASHGNQTSILLGDYLFTHAFHLSSTIGDARACRLIGEATNRVCEGELQQCTERGNLNLTEDEYLDIIDGKTAELTSCCSRLGALYADCDDETVERLANFGRCLGIAFQIADDLLDLVGEERTTGKSLGTDVEQQKLTLPIIRLMRKTETSDVVRKILESPGNHKREQLQPILKENGALLYARRRAEEYAQQAKRDLGCLPPSTYRDILEMLCERVIHRDA